MGSINTQSMTGFHCHQDQTLLTSFKEMFSHYFVKSWNRELKLRTVAKEMLSYQKHFLKKKIKPSYLSDAAEKTYECCLPESSCLETILSILLWDTDPATKKTTSSEGCEATTRFPVSANRCTQGVTPGTSAPATHRPSPLRCPNSAARQQLHSRAECIHLSHAH